MYFININITYHVLTVNLKMKRANSMLLLYMDSTY